MRIHAPYSRVLFGIAVASSILFGAANLQAQTYLIDFGGTGTQMEDFDDPSRIWNNVSATVGSTVNSAVTLTPTDNSESLLTLTIIERFNGANADGTQSSPLFPLDATRDSLFGNTGTAFNGIAAPNPTFTLSGLDPQKAYNFTFFASRMGVSGQIRTTDYLVSGAISGSTTLNVGENINNTASVFSITPTEFGEITIRLSASANNNNDHKFIYLGVLEIQAVPEPATAAMLAIGGFFALARRKRKSINAAV